jgi:hypothetical protein
VEIGLLNENFEKWKVVTALWIVFCKILLRKKEGWRQRF